MHKLPTVIGSGRRTQASTLGSETVPASRVVSGRLERAWWWGAAVLIALLSLARVVDVASVQLAAPFDLLYETPNLRTIQLLQQGRNIYDPTVYADAPFWITVYTPLYHYLVAALPSSMDNPFLAGRWVALCFMLLSALTVFVVGRRTLWVSVLAFALFFLTDPVVSNTAFLKNDSMGLLFSVSAVLCIARWRTSAWWVVASAVLCVAAFFSKQYFIAAPVACFLFLATKDWKKAVLFGVAGAGLLAALLAAAMLYWGSGFWFSVFGALRNPLTYGHFQDQWVIMLHQPVFVFLLVTAFAAMLWRWRRLLDAPFALYVLVSGAVVVALVGKEGSSTNYFFELTLASLLWLVFVCQDLPAAPSRRTVLLATIALLGCVAAQLATTQMSEISFTSRPAASEYANWTTMASNAIRQSSGTENPKILNLSRAKFSYLPPPGEISVNDPGLYWLLWESGGLSTQSLIRSIQERKFDGVLAPRGFLSLADAQTPLPDLHRAVRENYQASLDLGPLEYFVRSP
jgi:hypothetical protein